MRGLKAQLLLLAPVLVTALPTRHQVDNSYKLINLDINSTPNNVTLRLDILESRSPCGYGNVTINNQTLAQDEDGTGSGPITTEHGNVLLANWDITCVHLEDEFQGQVMTFEVVSVNDKKVQDVEFTVQFQQVAPISVSLLNATKSVIDTTVPGKASDNISNEKPPTTLDEELAELKSMMRQLAALESAISSKVRYISDVYDFKRPDKFHSFAECDSLKCIVGTMYNRAKHMASRLHGGPQWHEMHGYQASWLHKDHGNHPHHPFPHHPPPPPPPPSHGWPPHHSSHPPPPPESLPSPPPGLMPPPPPESMPPPPPGSLPPPPPPPPNHYIPGDDRPQEPPRPDDEFDGKMEPPIFHGDDEPRRPMHIIESDADFPGHPPVVLIPHGRPFHHGDEPHDKKPPHHPPHPHPHPPPPHFGPPGMFRPMSFLYIGATVVLLALLISAIHTRCFTASRQVRHAGCCGRHQDRERHCQNRGGARHTTIAAKYSEVIRWIREGKRRQEMEDEEKEAIMRRIGSESEEEDNLSTTMEQEIAQLRAVADVVGSLVAAEEGHSREYAPEARQHSVPMPPSPTSAFPDYASVPDEELPAYDEGSDDSRFVADGFRYTPGSSCYTSNESSTTGSSLDEHLGRKD